jgi:hypothetical protein
MGISTILSTVIYHIVDLSFCSETDMQKSLMGFADRLQFNPSVLILFNRYNNGAEIFAADISFKTPDPGR